MVSVGRLKKGVAEGRQGRERETLAKVVELFTTPIKSLPRAARTSNSSVIGLVDLDRVKLMCGERACTYLSIITHRSLKLVG